MRLISVIIGAENSKTRFNESSLLLSYGFANFENKLLVDMNSPLQKVKVNKGKIEEVEVYGEETFSVIVKKGDNAIYETNVEIPDNIKAPLKNGEVVGKVVITKEGNVIKEVNVVVKEDIKHSSYLDNFNKIVENW